MNLTTLREKYGLSMRGFSQHVYVLKFINLLSKMGFKGASSSPRLGRKYFCDPDELK